MRLIDRNKVLKGLEICSTGECSGCPYNSGYSAECLTDLARDALFILRPRVMTLEEVHDCCRTRSVFLEVLQEGGPLDWYGVFGGKSMVKQPIPERLKLRAGRPAVTVLERPGDVKSLPDDEYGRTWRCWNEKPSGRQMIEEAWKDDDR